MNTGNGDGKTGWRTDILAALQFFSRLPVPAHFHGSHDFGPALRAAPIAGAVIGAMAGVVLVVLLWLGMAPGLAAGFAVAALVVSTGAMHEDALADVADGFGGGQTRDRKLEIMRDSRTGTYGAAAVMLSLLLRWAAIAAFAEANGAFAFLVLVAAGAVSRGYAVLVPRRIPAARGDGLGVSAGVLSSSAAIQTIVIFVAAALLLAGPVAGFGWTVLALLFAWGVMRASCRLAMQQIAGHTGDVIGATQQAVEVVFLAILTLSLSTP